MISGPGASLYPFFDLHNVPIKTVKTDLPFVVSLFVEYTYYRKIGAWLNRNNLEKEEIKKKKEKMKGKT